MNRLIPADEAGLRADYHRYTGLYGKSRAISAMATDYGCTAQTVMRHLADHGIRARREIPVRPAADDFRVRYEAVLAESGQRALTGKLAQEYGVTQVTIRQWLADDGLREMKPRVPPKPILDPCPCGAVATTRYRGQDPPLCFRCYMRTWATDKDTKFRRTAREYLAEAKRNAVCADCGGTFDPVAYHFDHVPDRGPKLFNVANCDVSIDRLKAEIAKCDIVCANCHAVRTWKTRGQPWLRKPVTDGNPEAEAASTLF